MKALTGKIAKIIYAVPIIIFGVSHFLNAEEMAGYVPSYIPGGVFWIYLTGLALMAAGLAIIIQKMAKLASLLLALLLLVFILTIHLPGALHGEQMTIIALLKDVGLLSGALLIAGSSK